MHEASFYRKADNNAVVCDLCPHRCTIPDGKRGLCRVRKNKDGTLYALTYENCISRRPDPIEKKPLYHFLPGTFSYSIASQGCNLKCRFCQNYSISQVDPAQPLSGIEYKPEAIVADALKTGCKSISYTYTEPTIYLEYALAAMPLAKGKGLANVFVSNGYIQPDIIRNNLADLLDAINIDLKFFKDQSYVQFCSAHLEPVKEAIRVYKECGVWVEVTTLVIPGLNDSDEELTAIAQFIADIDTAIPWHISRYHSDFQMTQVPPTPVETVFRARNIGLINGLTYVYCGNLYSEDTSATYCPGCHKPVVTRSKFTLTGYNIINKSVCKRCGTAVDGIWS